MAIKKALYGRQPGCFYFWFYLCPLAVTRDLVFSLISGIFNKVPSFTHFGLKKLLFACGDFIPAQVCAWFDFYFLFCNSECADIFTVTATFHPLYSSICSEFLDMLKSGRKIRFSTVSFLARFCPILFDACFELLNWILLIQLGLLIGIQHYRLPGHSHEFFVLGLWAASNAFVYHY